jgi:hypothetical protein
MYRINFISYSDRRATIREYASFVRKLLFLVRADPNISRYLRKYENIDGYEKLPRCPVSSLPTHLPRKMFMMKATGTASERKFLAGLERLQFVLYHMRTVALP